MSDPARDPRRWIEKGDADRRAVEVLRAASPPDWPIVCFHAQQSAEKYLKAFLAAHNELPPKTHDLVALLQRCTGFDPAFSQLEVPARRLTFYAALARYPEARDSDYEAAGVELIAIADSILAAVRQRFA